MNRSNSHNNSAMNSNSSNMETSSIRTEIDRSSTKDHIDGHSTTTDQSSTSRVRTKDNSSDHKDSTAEDTNKVSTIVVTVRTFETFHFALSDHIKVLSIIIACFAAYVVNLVTHLFNAIIASHLCVINNSHFLNKKTK